MNNATIFLSGTILLFLLICQLYKVYIADADYKKELARYLANKKQDKKSR